MVNIVSIRVVMKPYIFCIDSDYKYSNPSLDGITFKSDWCHIDDGVITINKGYAWDGCSPKQDLFGLAVIGTPDGRLKEGKPITYHASLVHDALCQFRSEIKISKAATLSIFNDMLLEAGFIMRPVYVTAVDWFGPQNFRG